MFKTHFTKSCVTGLLAAGLLLGAGQIWAQDQNPPNDGNQVNDSHAAALAPSNVSQPAPVNQQQSRLAEPLRPLAEVQTDGLPANEYSAPPLPPPENAGVREHTADYAPAESSASAPAELGVLMWQNDGPGVPISSVTAGSAADQAGLRPGDYVLSVQGHSVASPADVRDRIRENRPGDTIELNIWRDGAEQRITVTLGQAQGVALTGEEFLDPSVQYAVRPTYFYRGPVYGRYYSNYPDYDYGYYPGRSYYAYPYGYGGVYYGAPRFGYYASPWGAGVRVGPFGVRWR
jgi:PDZ domain